MKEIFVKISGYNGNYEVSNLGNVISWINTRRNKLEKPKKLNPLISHNGYQYVRISDGKNKNHNCVHRLVAKEFIENPKNKKFVNHKNGIKTDNRVENLEWCTRKENEAHALKNGLKPRGESCGKSKLTKTQVLKIRNMRGMGKSCLEIANIFNVTEQNIYCIINRKTWKHI